MLLHRRLILRLRLMLLRPRLILRLRLHLRLSLRLRLSRSGSRCEQDPELVMTGRQAANTARMLIAGLFGRTVPAFR
jgi:hypothetical protein